LVYPPQPVYQEPPAPGPLAGAFGGKKRHQAAVERAQAEHGAAVQQWHEHNQALYEQYLAADEARKQTEEERLRKLADAEALYKEQCRQGEVYAAARNQELAKLINDLAFDVESAIEEYVGIVLANSVYPDAFPVSHEHEFDLRSRELTLTVTVPQPSDLPTAKEYRYVKARDEITASALPVREQKERYANAVWQVAIRSLHEVFEADRAGKIHSIGLLVGVNRTAPATGLPETVPLAAVAADRETFTQFDLANVVPQATLEHLGAALSKSPFDLAPADTSHGVRVRGHES
jgi:restriction system protein